MKTLNAIRSEFLSFFEKNGHRVVPSSPLVPQNDPTLMFTNSGMVQFKNVFTGSESRDYSRAASAQKCVRAGGKHNDLENVGYTARHHTFFEMMGNFSFGDYFKEEAIALAWELVTKNFGMPKDKLLVTVYHTDEVAAALWKKIAGFDDSKIIRIKTNDNYWMMGDTGPCGPSSEIFFDQGDKLFGGPPGSPAQDGDRFLEFWNLVFMQFEQEPDGQGGYNRKPLPKPSIDTGMGLERTAALMQGLSSVYDVDLLRHIIEHCANLTGVNNPDGAQAPSFRVIADHLRASAFLIAEGVSPSNEGRGYVLRRIMRRGMRHAHLLGAKEPLMHRLFPTLEADMGAAYPELRQARALIVDTLKSEEERFRVTLERGLKLLEEETDKIRNNILPGEVAFRLYDTYGFPLDLTQDALRARGISVDTAGFDVLMQSQRIQARKSWSGAGGEATEKLWFEILDEAGPTEFLGYETELAEGVVRAVLRNGIKMIRGAAQKDNSDADYILITNQSPFYAESGGQIGDSGFITGEKGRMRVTDTRKFLGNLWAHVGKMEEGIIHEGESLRLNVDHDRRAAIRANHSATHLMHAALRRVLGDHVTQKGSLQDENRTRFDISHPKPLSAEEIKRVEDIVNAEIRADAPVETRLMGLDEARESGAMALFGEKYDDEVRVVSMGTRGSGANAAFSVELCGGTHVGKTGDIGAFKIVSESALSSGIRRIEALTGGRVSAHESNLEQTLQDELSRKMQINKTLKKQLTELGGTAPGETFAGLGAQETIDALDRENKKLQKDISDRRLSAAIHENATASDSMSAAHAGTRDAGGVKLEFRVLDDFPPGDLKSLADSLKARLGSGVVALIAVNEGKASLVVAVTEDLTGRFSAVDLVKQGAAALGGKGGGGRPDMAQAGGPDAGNAYKAITAIETALDGAA